MTPSPASDDTLMQTLNLIATIPSIIGASLMTYYSIRNLSANAFVKLILLLALSDLFYSISNVMSLLQSPEGSIACITEGVLRMFTKNFSICVASSIALLHYHVIKMDLTFKKSRFLVISIVSGALLSLIFALR